MSQRAERLCMRVRGAVWSMIRMMSESEGRAAVYASERGGLVDDEDE